MNMEKANGKSGSGNRVTTYETVGRRRLSERHMEDKLFFSGCGLSFVDPNRVAAELVAVRWWFDSGFEGVKVAICGGFILEYRCVRDEGLGA